MKTVTPKKLKTLTPAKAVKKQATKKLSKSDPDYYSKIGQISAAKRKMTSEQFSAMAKRSHNPASRPNGYHGGRPRKVQETE